MKQGSARPVLRSRTMASPLFGTVARDVTSAPVLGTPLRPLLGTAKDVHRTCRRAFVPMSRGRATGWRSE